MCREDDAKWPKRNKDGRQELEIRLGNEHIAFDVRPLPLSDQESPMPLVFHPYRNILGWFVFTVDLG
jgi:Mago nashi protein